MSENRSVTVPVGSRSVPVTVATPAIVAAAYWPGKPRSGGSRGAVACSEPMGDEHHRYVALVRAINIGGKSVMKNEQLRRVFESVGCSEIVTHRQSGNAVFSTKRGDAKRLSGQLADELEHATGYATTVYVLAAD